MCVFGVKQGGGICSKYDLPCMIIDLLLKQLRRILYGSAASISTPLGGSLLKDLMNNRFDEAEHPPLRSYACLGRQTVRGCVGEIRSVAL